MKLDLLIKLMRMTTSDSDGEALVAIRKANAMLATEKKDWGDVLLGTPATARSQDNSFRTPPSRRGPPPTNPYADAWKRAEATSMQEMLDALLKTVTDTDFRRFVLSVKSYYDHNGTLSDAQAEAIRRAYNRATTQKKERGR